MYTKTKADSSFTHNFFLLINVLKKKGEVETRKEEEEEETLGVQ